MTQVYFRSRLSEMLAERRLSIREFANIIGHRRESVRQLANGELVRLPVELLRKACEELGCELSDLIMFNEEEKEHANE